MVEITISDKHHKEIERFIQDGFVKRVFGYNSVTDFIVCAIEGQMEADKDIARIPQ